MLLPCPIVVHPAAVPMVHGLLPAARRTLSHALHHGVHRVHHVVHAAARHTQSVVAAACHVGPAALAIAALGVLAPTPSADPHRDSISPSGTTTQQSPAADRSPGWVIPGANGAVPSMRRTPPDPVDPGSTLLTLTPGEIPPSPSASQILAPYVAPAVQRGMALAAIAPTDPARSNPASTAGAQPVPEPPSLLVLGFAVCGLGLIRHTPMPYDRTTRGRASKAAIRV